MQGVISLPPKVKFSREEIIAAALDIVREGGMTALTARSLAARLGSSAKPVFGLFENMQEVQKEVVLAANAEYQEFLYAEMMRGIYKPYKATGMAYIDFARKEKELFKILFMHDRTKEIADIRDESVASIIALIMRNTGLSEENARLLHLEMWMFVHGIATMIVTNYLDLKEDYISRALSDAYEGLKALWLNKMK